MKIKWNLSAFEDIRRDPAVASDVDRRAAKIAAQASTVSGETYVSSPYEGKTRHRASVRPDGYKAIRAEHKGNYLLGALDAGR